MNTPLPVLLSVVKQAFADNQLTGDDMMTMRNYMRENGMEPPYASSDGDMAGKYNQTLLRLRDEKSQGMPDLEVAKAALKGGGLGALLGAAGGDVAGSALQHVVKPHLAHNLPHYGRYGGSLLGALAGGVPAALKAKSETELFKKLNNPHNLHQAVDSLAQERQAANYGY